MPLSSKSNEGHRGKLLRVNEEESGAPGGIRTPDLLVRSQTLYPAELQARRQKILTQARSAHLPAGRKILGVAESG